MSKSRRSSSASANSETRCCRLEWRPSRWLGALLWSLALLAPLSLIASDLPRGVAWPLALVVLWRLWLQVAPGAGTADWTALLLAQLFVLARIWARLAFIASEVVFFQGELAHARYTAAPDPVWPDSPAVEAIRRLER